MGRSGCGHVSGPLAPYAEGFRKELLEQGYTWGSAAKQVHLMAHASRWLDAGALEPGELTSGAIGRFLEARRAASYGRLVSPRAIAPLVGYLGELGVVAPERPPTPRPAEALVERYATYLCLFGCAEETKIRAAHAMAGAQATSGRPDPRGTRHIY